MIPYGRQDISEDDIRAVVSVLKSDYLTQGEIVPKFEQRFACKVSCKYTIAANSATSALHIACLSLGLRKGDYLWTVPNTFVASANCGLYCGAKVDFVDIDPLTYNMSIQKLTEKLNKSSTENTLPKVVIPVAFSGLSCDMEEIFKLSKKYGFKVIEDASHAIGGKYKGEMIGNCKYSDVTIFSFHPVKIITSAEGGMVATNNKDLAKKMKLLRSHGINRDDKEMVNKVDGQWYYEQSTIGFNYRMTDVHAALGLSQLKRLDNFVEKRKFIANYYNQALKELPLTLPLDSKSSSWHLYVIKVDPKRTNISRNFLFKRMRELGVGVNVHYIPVHLQPFYQKKGFKRGDFPISEKYYDNVLSLPIFPTMTPKQKKKVVDALHKILK
jgi:UDP-4-amino-4,6-dideoxy-N-acetyl-beta-L-altrosamine transaminase